jgi:hypothetical protein
MPYTQEKLQEKFWEQAADVFGYDIIGSKTHPMKKAFETFCEMIKEQETDDETDNETDIDKPIKVKLDVVNGKVKVNILFKKEEEN